VARKEERGANLGSRTYADRVPRTSRKSVSRWVPPPSGQLLLLPSGWRPGPPCFPDVDHSNVFTGRRPAARHVRFGRRPRKGGCAQTNGSRSPLYGLPRSAGAAGARKRPLTPFRSARPLDFLVTVQCSEIVKPADFLSKSGLGARLPGALRLYLGPKW
jgi:hypothetical protein